MAPSKTRSLADQLADLEDPTPKDFDPEDLENDGPSSDEDGAGQPSDVNAGREHYEAVGKGKLRKPDPVRLGKQYAGERISRDALDADSDDDPFAAHTDDEDISENSDDESDSDAGSDGPLGIDDDSDASEQPETGAKQQKTLSKTQRKKSMNSQSDSDLADSDSNVDEDIEEEDDSEDDDDDDFDEEEEDGMEDESEDDEVEVVKKKRDTKVHSGSGAASDDREELRRLMASDQKTIAATISQAAKADATKGKAVKEQRTTFDALLNTRIKLQKGLSAINEVSALAAGEKDAGSDEHGEADEEAIKSAESAALALWSTLEELRNALADAHSQDGSKKRKRPSPITPTTKSALLWERMADLESESLAHRRSTLDKWSSKVRGTSTSLPNARGKLLGSGSKQSITAVLDAHVATEIGDRSSKRARQSNGSSTETPEPVYDDTVFYQSLLRELVEQRMSSDAMTGGLDTQLPSRLPIHPITGMRNDKLKRENVDTRASKGRKMRFNVHEKLQNFMAPEDRGSWTVRARDEFFASLLGKTASGLLGEGDESGSDMESDEDREEGGLKLFRN